MTDPRKRYSDEAMTDLAQVTSSLQLFLVIYRYLLASVDWKNAFVRRHELKTPRANKLAKYWRRGVIAAVETRPDTKITDYFKKALSMVPYVDAAETGIVLLMGLRAIDKAFAGAHLFGADAKGFDLPFRTLRTRLRQGEPFDAWEGFRLYPKPRAGLQLRGQRLNDVFDYLSIVHPPALGAIPVKYLAADAGSALHCEQLSRVGLIPVVLAPHEVAWELKPHEQYRVGLHPATRAGVIQRVIDALNWLMTRKPEIIVLPELVSHPELIGEIRLYLADRTARRLFVPHLVLCGSFMAPSGAAVKNRAVVLAGHGGELWQQDKLNAYFFSADEQERVGKPFNEAICTSRTEDIAIHPEGITVYDLGPSLRSAVFICEDFQQAGSMTAVEDWDMSLLLIPIMNAPMDESQWANLRALALSARPAVMSTIINSGTLVAPLRPNATAKRMAEKLACIIGAPRVDVRWERYMVSPFPHPAALFGNLKLHATSTRT